MKYAITAAATFALFSSASAHFYMKSPQPIQGNVIKDPLDPSGSNFPCHGSALPGSGGVPMSVGSTQNLIFDEGQGSEAHKNTAVHGGGSCQISITYETDPVKVKDPNNWKVIMSMEGGCPTNSVGNLGDTYQGPQGSYSGAYQCSDPIANGYDCVNAFPYTIPRFLMNGQATLAWTWFNAVGNREMYMNCAAVNIQGGSSDLSALQSLPSMFVANLASVGGGSCRTVEGTAVGFPNPGNNVVRQQNPPNVRLASAKEKPIQTPSSGCPSGGYAAPAASGNPSPSNPAPSYGAPSLPAPAPTTTLKTSVAPVPSNTGAPVPITTSIRKRPVENSTKAGRMPKPTGSGAVSLPLPTASQGACPVGSVSCTGVNSIVCIDDGHFGICDYNGCAYSQNVASGTMCSQGAITWAKSKKRHLARHIAAKHLS